MSCFEMLRSLEMVWCADRRADANTMRGFEVGATTFNYRERRSYCYGGMKIPLNVAWNHKGSHKCGERMQSNGKNFGVILIGFAESDRGGARTHDQRINLPHRLSPTDRFSL